jgi:hypothetical protein
MTNRRIYTLIAIALLAFWASIPALIWWAVKS